MARLTPESGAQDWEAVLLRAPSGELEADFIPHAGMVGWSLRHRGEDLLVRRMSLSRYVESGHPAGIPLLHPWANRLASPRYEIAGQRVELDMSASNVHADPSGLPIHGLVAGCPHWEITERGRSRLDARLDFGAWPELMAGFPFPHVLELTLELSDSHLAVDTRLTPTAQLPVPVAFGFHPYLRLPGLERERWRVELPVTSRMELDQRMLPTGRSEAVSIAPGPLGDRTFDDAFDGLADPPEFVIEGAHRRIALRLRQGYRFAQVYAPPGSEFICFEPMTAPGNPFASEQTLLAAPGESYLARFEIAVSG